MAGTRTTLNIKDSSGTARPMRVWDESGTGIGPYSFAPTNDPQHDEAVFGVATVTDVSSHDLIAAAGASLKNYVKSLQLSNAGAGAALVSLKDGSGGSVLWNGYIKATDDVQDIHFDPPLVGGTNTAVAIILTAATSPDVLTVYANAQGYKAV